MKPLLFAVLAIVCALAFVACPNPATTSFNRDINGTWNLSTIQGAPVAAISCSGSIIVSNSSTYTSALTTPGGTFPSEGTITLQSDGTYLCTPTDLVNYSTHIVTLSADGKSFSFVDFSYGAMVYTKQ